MQAYYHYGSFVVILVIIMLLSVGISYFLLKAILKKWLTSKALLVSLSLVTVFTVSVIIYSGNGYKAINSDSKYQVFLYKNSKVIDLVDYAVVTNLNTLQFSTGLKKVDYTIKVPPSKFLTSNFITAVNIEVIYEYEADNNYILLRRQCESMLAKSPKIGDYNLDDWAKKSIMAITSWEPKEPKFFSIEYYYKQYLVEYFSGTGIKIKAVNTSYFDPPLARGPHQN